MSEFKNMLYPDEPIVSVLGTYSSVDGNYNFALEIPKTGLGMRREEAPETAYRYRPGHVTY